MSSPKIYSYTRFSSEKQRRGDSVRRQIEAAEQWSKTEGKGLELDTSLRDEGISGFKGRNAEVGALGGFLNAVRNGRVAPGSILLVENLDRISRHDPMKAMRVLETVVEAGVDVVTLQDHRRYTRENIAHDVSNLIIALITFARGNEESRTKSLRLCAVWGNKRREAAESRKVLSTWVHPWIRVVGVKRYGIKADFSSAKYELDNGRAKLVRQIFRWAASGWGYWRIAQELRALRVKPWGRAPWSITRISKVVKNRAVIGEYQPCRYEGGAYGKRVPDGAPIKDYFPRVVSDEEFAAAQPTRINKPLGPPQKRIRLLSGILFDSQNRLMYVHANSRDGFPAYQTAFNRLGPGDRAVRWSAEHLERCVVAACHEIDWPALYDGDTSELQRMQALLVDLGREEAEVRRRLANAAKSLLDGEFGILIKGQVQQMETRLLALRHEKAEAQTQLDQLRRATATAPRVTTREVPTDFETRERLQTQLRTVLSKVQVWPDGKTPDAFWKLPLERAKELAPPRAVHSIATDRVMGAIRLFFRNGRAITAYVTFVLEGKNRDAKVLGFANPQGMTAAEWDKISSFAGLYETGFGGTVRSPKWRPRAKKR